MERYPLWLSYRRGRRHAAIRSRLCHLRLNRADGYLKRSRRQRLWASTTACRPPLNQKTSGKTRFSTLIEKLGLRAGEVELRPDPSLTAS